jgi:hypothetical protein
MPKKLKLPFEECPYCGSEEGFYRKGRVRGSYICRYNADGTNADNTHLHDTINYVEQKTAYCVDCEKPLGIVDI